jgi:hypothetical protein
MVRFVPIKKEKLMTDCHQALGLVLPQHFSHELHVLTATDWRNQNVGTGRRGERLQGPFHRISPALPSPCRTLKLTVLILAQSNTILFHHVVRVVGELGFA